MTFADQIINQSQEHSIEDLLDQITESQRSIDTHLVRKAYDVAHEYHLTQKRKSGEPYIIHPLEVGYILFELGMDTESICAGLLHDVIEDTECTQEQLTKMFGSSIAVLVDGLTKLRRLTLTTKEEQQTENVRKMLLAMSRDIRVVIIKLADRLHNMRTLQFMPEVKRREIALETMEVFAPIAHRLGIRAIKEELEDRALHYLDPVACSEIEKTLEMKKTEREEFITTIQKRIIERLAQHRIPVHIEGRVKSLYGIYRKVYVAGKSFDEVFDIYAVRIIVNTDIDCYNILGIIHDMFRPIPNRFKDYISTPKPNGYRSLHTTVISKESIPFEVQIRTWDMHYTAEYGIAAHWKYKVGIKGTDKMEDTLAWIRQIIQNQQESEGAEDLIKTIKTDLAADEVYAFTPKGDVKCLPAGSTVVDFAYAIHSQVGNKMLGAKIDSRIVSLDTPIKTGQIVEIITTKSQSHGPNREWLKFAKTSEARSKIRAWFKKERFEENVEQGQSELEREFKRNNIILDDDQYEDFVGKLARRQHYESIIDFYAAIGYGGAVLSKVMQRVKEDYHKTYLEVPSDTTPTLPEPSKSTNGIVVEGIDNCEVRLSQCCNPLPGDDIIGFITKGHGVSVHKRDCPNMVAIYSDKNQEGRWINVGWAKDATVHYRGTIDIIAHNRTTLMADIGGVLSNCHVQIHELSAREIKNGDFNVVITIFIDDTEQLKSIIQKLRKLEGAIFVERSGKA